MAKVLHSTNCFNTLIRVAEDCPAQRGEEPETSQASASSGAVTCPRACRVVRMENSRLARMAKSYLTQDVRYR